MKDIRYRQISNQGKILFCNLITKDIQEIESLSVNSKKINNGKTRAGKLLDENNTVYAFTDDKIYIQSAKKFNIVLKILLNSATYIEQTIQNNIESHNKAINRLIHNLITLNAHNMQELYVLFPQQDISRKINKKQIKYIEDIIKEKSKEIALFLLKQAKSNTAMDVEFSVFQMIHNNDDSKLQIQSHNVHQVIMNILYIFFPDFTDKDVAVVVNDSTHKARFDYKSFHVVLYHILENATKYIKPKSKFLIDIKNNNGKIEIDMEMISCKIQEDEKLLIFKEGYSGKEPKKIGRNGKGIGLSIVKKIIELNSGTIDIYTDDYSEEIIMGCYYQKNNFIICLPK